jgi:hypothetical protein
VIPGYREAAEKGLPRIYADDRGSGTLPEMPEIAGHRRKSELEQKG